MSQADEETAKYTKINKHQQQHHYNHYGQMRKTTSNQQVMPLYENCTLTNSSSSNNNKHKPDQILVERSPAKSETFNNDYRFVSNTTNDADIVSEQQARDFNTSVSSDYVYENITIGDKESLDKRILLQKYFRSALVGPRTGIYENLCRGCNYGVFNARGPLCTFCECIVNGVSALRSDTPETSLCTSNNIYENICEHCGAIYSGSNCLQCQCPQTEQQQQQQQSVKSEENENFAKLGSEELLIEQSVKQKKNIKINKSKSFSKTNKPKIFTNLWDTIRKPKSHTPASVNKRPLEIVHHVEGFEQVFHTKDTFDLKKICELKRSATSCSDQHIYGRLKLQEDLITPQDEFNSTQSLTQTITTAKRPRISKAKFLRTTASKSSFSAEVKTDLPGCTIYLNNSVCQWMTSLRREIHAYNTFDEHDQEILCYPKSIPSKSVLNSCKAPMLVTNRPKNVQNSTQEHNEHHYVDLAEILQGLSDHNSVISTDSGELLPEVEKTQEQIQPDCYQLRVEEFMANILNRQMLRVKSNNQQIDNAKATMAGVNSNDSDTNNCNNNNSNINCNYNYEDGIDNTIDIPLRQAAQTAITTTTTTTTYYHNAHNNNKHKRQGMYLPLADHQQQQLRLPNGREQTNLQNNNRNEIYNKNYKNNFACQDESENVFNSENNIEHEYLNSLRKPNTVTTTPDTLLTSENNDTLIVGRCANQSEFSWQPLKADRRQGIHELNVLEAFEALLEQEKSNQLLFNNQQQIIEAQKCEKLTETKSQPHIADKALLLSCHQQIPDLMPLINQQHISAALNTLLICYDKYLKVFLKHNNSQTTTNVGAIVVFKISNKRLVRKFQRFYNYCEKNNEQTTRSKALVRDSTCVSSKLKLDLNITNNCAEHAQIRTTNISDSVLDTLNDLTADNSSSASVIINKPRQQTIKTPPQVPKRDPKTKLSPTSESKRLLNANSKMTKPGIDLKTEASSEVHTEEESIYQPIWKFETRGQVQERYRTDDDYYDFKALRQKFQQDSPHSEIPKILVSSDLIAEEEEDHYNWETDEEFVFTKQQKKQRSSSLSSERLSTMRSTHSSNSSIGTSPSLSGSTITEFASSTATLASTLSCSLRHYLFRNIGIFYSLTEPKLRAIIYDYDRIHSSRYFAKPFININDSGLGKSLSTPMYGRVKHSIKTSASNTSSPSTSAKSSPITATKRIKSSSTSDKCTTTATVAKTKATTSNNFSAVTPLAVPDSVQAWKLQLMDVNYMEDEEDMIVSECEILRAQQMKEEIDQPPSIPPQKFVQHFKSRSTENFLDLPIEDDKKTIAERLANMYTRFSPIQRGILNINGRNSPKSEKKAYKLNRASQSTSLYLEDGLKPKYPIFGAPLDQLELQQNVPRFVVDAVDYIERKDRIIQDGIYRACGNKFSIDELKQKLEKHYIYDSKLIVADDIHTVTSLLKQFFRDLPEPVIPQEVYNCITANLTTDKQGIDAIQIALENMKEPNKSTLRFLIKHLTNVAACSSSNRMNASNMAIVWGPSLFAQNDTYDMIGRMNTLTKVLIENYDRIFATNERLL